MCLQRCAPFCSYASQYNIRATVTCTHTHTCACRPSNSLSRDRTPLLATVSSVIHDGSDLVGTKLLELLPLPLLLLLLRLLLLLPLLVLQLPLLLVPVLLLLPVSSAGAGMLLAASLAFW